MSNLEVYAALVVIRGMAAVTLFVFFVRTRDLRHLVLFLAWVLYTVSGLLRVPIYSNPVQYWNLTGITADVSTMMFASVAIGYLFPRVLRWSIPAAGIILIPSVLVLVFSRCPDLSVLLMVFQAVFIASIVGIYGRYWQAAKKVFFEAPYLAVIVFGAALVYIPVYAFFDLPQVVKVSGTAIINMLMLSFFVYAEHSLVLAEAHLATRRLNQAEKAVGLGYWERDGNDARAQWSPGHFEIFGLPPTPVPPSWPEFLGYVHPDDRRLVEEAFHASLTRGSSDAITYRIVRQDGEQRWVTSNSSSIESGLTYGIIVDISSLKEAQDRLEQSLKEKETLLSEIHHRVKNNLQIVSSMLNLQLGSVEDDAIRSLIERTGRHIHAMSSVQELLLQADDLSRIEMQGFIVTLIDYAADSVLHTSIVPEIEVQTDGITLAADIALPVGMIVFELIANAFEHAFPNPAAGKIRVVVESLDGTCHVRVIDNGIGVSTLRRTQTVADHSPLGMTLVDSFVSQLSGNIEFETTSGTSVHIEFDTRNSVNC